MLHHGRTFARTGGRAGSGRAALLLAVVAAAGTAAGGCRKGSREGSGPVVWDLTWMTRVKEEAARGDKAHGPALARLRQEADAALKAGPFSVVNKKLTPPSGDKHDYMSVAPYWWPDPARPDGLPYIRKDGERNPARNSDATDNAAESAMAAAVETLGLAYFFTDDERYAEHAVKLLRTWFIDPATRMNPNLNFAQSIPGVTPGRPAGVIDTVDLIGMLEGVALLARSRAYTGKDDEALRAWFQDYLAWLMQSEIGLGEKAATNNHGSWYDAQVVRFALHAGRKDVAQRVAADAGMGRIAAQIQADGRQPRELGRTRSFHYSGYNLTALFTLAAMSANANLGTDLFTFQTHDGRSLRRALNYLLPFLNPDVPWPYQQLGSRDNPALISLLRRARRVYDDPRYESVLNRRFGGQLADHRSRLVLPP
jgi:hypothetical protein